MGGLPNDSDKKKFKKIILDSSKNSKLEEDYIRCMSAWCDMRDGEPECIVIFVWFYLLCSFEVVISYLQFNIYVDMDYILPRANEFQLTNGTANCLIFLIIITKL